MSMRNIILPPSSHPLKKTLFLDLDDTLVKTITYAEYNCLIEATGLAKKPDFSVCFERPSGKYEHRLVFLLHGLKSFLNEMASMFEVVLFTAATASYAEAILELIDPDQEFFSHVLSRKHCLIEEDETLPLKDLSKVEGRSLSKMILLDDATEQIELNEDNAIQICPFGDNMGEDCELEGFALLAKEIASSENV